MAITQKKLDYNAILNAASNQGPTTLPYTPGSSTLQAQPNKPGASTLQTLQGGTQIGTSGGMTNEQLQAAYFAALNGGMSNADIGAALQDMAKAQPVNPNTVNIGGTNYDAGMFTGDGYYWKGGKLYSTATGKEATQTDYDAVDRIAIAEGVDRGVAASMYRANQAYDTNSYGDGAWKAETETALQNALANGTSGDFVRLPNESLQDMADRVLATRQAETGAQVVNYGAGNNLIGGSGGTGSGTPSDSGTPAGTMYQQILGSYTGTPDANQYGNYGDYQGDQYAYNQMTAGQYGNAPERQNTYEPEYQRILQAARNTPAFQWDQGTDPVWQALAKQYRREGQRATADTMGAAAGMTGGIPSSYAVTAAAQAGNYYAGQLSDRLPEVYQQAYQRYLDEYSRRLGLADYYAQGMQMEENRFNTDLNQFNQNRSFRYGVDSDNWNRAYELNNTDYQRYLDAVNKFNQDRSFQYGVDSDNWDRNMANQKLQISEQQRQIENAMNIAQTYGYIPNQQVADILGLPVGTKTSSQQYQEWEQNYKDASLGADLMQDERDFNYQQYLDDYDIGRQMDNDRYNRRQTEQADAQQRIASFLSIGGDVSQLDPELIAQSGYSKAELNQMQRYYAQQAELAAQKAAGNGGGSGSGGYGGGSAGYVGDALDYNEFLKNYENGSPVTQDTINQMLVPETAQFENQQVQSLMALYPNGEINENDWATVADVFGEGWLQGHGFRKRSFAGEYRADLQTPNGSFDIPTQIEKAKTSYGGAMTFLRNYNASDEFLGKLRPQSETGMTDQEYADYLNRLINAFVESISG